MRVQTRTGPRRKRHVMNPTLKQPQLRFDLRCDLHCDLRCDRRCAVTGDHDHR